MEYGNAALTGTEMTRTRKTGGPRYGLIDLPSNDSLLTITCPCNPVGVYNHIVDVTPANGLLDAFVPAFMAEVHPHPKGVTMKLFLSWSGPLSLKVACVFRDWLPSVLQSVRPYVSSEDIDKGARWSTDIAKELQESSFGIICVTRDNLQTAWINFEAGALSKTVEKSKVCPLLFNLKRSEIQGPLLQFQSALCESSEIEKLMASINSTLPDDEKLDEPRLKKVFVVWWPELERQLDAIGKDEHLHSAPKPAPPKESMQAILEELLELSRTQTKLLNSPDELLPPGYLNSIFQDLLPPRLEPDPQVRDAIEYLTKKHRELMHFFENVKDGKFKADGDALDACSTLAADLDGVIRFLGRATNLPPRRRSSK